MGFRHWRGFAQFHLWAHLVAFMQSPGRPGSPLSAINLVAFYKYGFLNGQLAHKVLHKMAKNNI